MIKVLHVGVNEIHRVRQKGDNLLLPLTLPNGNQFLVNVNSHSRTLYAIARPSVVCLSSVTFVRPTQAVQIFGNISTALGTPSIH